MQVTPLNQPYHRQLIRRDNKHGLYTEEERLIICHIYSYDIFPTVFQDTGTRLISRQKLQPTTHRYHKTNSKTHTQQIKATV